MALLNLSASPDGFLYKDSITRFWGPKPQGLPYHILSHGDIVLISRHAPGALAARDLAFLAYILAAVLMQALSC